jgi:hypothetical protein
MNSSLSVTDRYVLMLSALLLGTSILFAWSGETRTQVFFSVYLIETLAFNQLAVMMSRRARACTARVERVLVACFVVLVVWEIARVIGAM